MATGAGGTIRRRGALWPRREGNDPEELPEASPCPGLTPRFLLGVACCVALAMVWRAMQSYPTGVFDLYPLYYGAKAWFHSGNAYDIVPVAPPEHAPFG